MIGLASAGIGGIFGIAANAANNNNAQVREKIARLENFRYGEIQAENADKRSRALYNDLMSPAALRKQYKEAGLSPSIMFGGSAIGGQTQAGAQGNSAAVSPTTYGINPLEAAEIGLTLAQTQKVKEETKNVSTDTVTKELKNEFEKLSNEKYKNEFTILNAVMTHTDTTGTTNFSLFEIADLAYDFDTFVKWSRETAEKNGNNDFVQASLTENGMKQLRSIYESYNKFGHDIAVLSNEKVDAEFQESITRVLNDSNFAELNKEQQIGLLKKQISANKLDNTQKSAWNNVLKRLEKSNASSFDITMVIGMILQHFIDKIGIVL